jgi:uncharacterized zinc-type alcohol dehydrogenase-like protein
MCREFPTVTYNGRDRISGEITYGGYAKHIVVREEFVLNLPEELDPSAPRRSCVPVLPFTPRCEPGMWDRAHA